MTFRILVTEKLGRMFGVLAHPHRLRIVEELGSEERDVASLQGALGISHSGVSQHLAQLRALELVVERREGRHVFYRLMNPELATWILDGLRFIEPSQEQLSLRSAVKHARALWGSTPPKRPKPRSAGG
jgi:DNA-binding transcriptional ArsR family regulator